MIWCGIDTLKNIRNYKIKISHSAQNDIENLSDFLLLVKNPDSARKYLDTMIAEIQLLSLFADLYRQAQWLTF